MGAGARESWSRSLATRRLLRNAVLSRQRRTNSGSFRVRRPAPGVGAVNVLHASRNFARGSEDQTTKTLTDNQALCSVNRVQVSSWLICYPLAWNSREFFAQLSVFQPQVSMRRRVVHYSGRCT